MAEERQKPEKHAYLCVCPSIEEKLSQEETSVFRKRLRRKSRQKNLNGIPERPSDRLVKKKEKENLSVPEAPTPSYSPSERRQ